MKNFKKLILFTAFALSASLILPAEASKKPWWICCTSQEILFQPSAIEFAEASPTKSSNLAGVSEAFSPSIDGIKKLSFDQYEFDHCIQSFQEEDYPEVYTFLRACDLEEIVMLRQRNPFHFVYKQDGIIKGVCVITPDDRQVKLLVVRQEFQSQGIGRKLLLTGMYKLKSFYPSMHEINLESTESAIYFYMKCGFQVERKQDRWMCTLTF